MSRYCGGDNAQPILQAAEYWREHALQKDESVFADTQLWSVDNLEEIEKYFVNSLDESEGTFFPKLKTQLVPSSRNAKKLAAEMFWVLYLCPTNLTSETKLKNIRTVWEWSGDSLPKSSSWLIPLVLKGVGSGGQSYSRNLWRELVFFVRAMLALKKLDQRDRARILADGWIFDEWLSAIPESDARQFRHMLLFMLFPDRFERIFSGIDRRAIVSRFTQQPQRAVDALSPVEIDRQLFEIRTEQESKYETKELDFYEAPLVGIWQEQGFERFTKDIERPQVLKALEEIDRTGIPSDARSTTYDLIEGVHRYPPKLVLSLASKYASGEEFDRSLFSGGEASQAFALLRKLGFHIERKDFIETLISKFLAQSEAADDLSTKNYPKSYRGLQVAVSFGKGNFGKIPWISFLGYGQKTQEGIYPVYLFYQDLGVLILAYGISETKTPAHTWKNIERAETVGEFISKEFDQAPDRYGESLVFAAYRVPADISFETLARDLDRLISVYQAQFGNASEIPPEITTLPPIPEPLPIPPYTLDDALSELFIEPLIFNEMLKLWERKKNIILQGPPGVGKTFVARRLAYAFMHEKAKDRVEAIQFHQTYAYEDFVQGYRPSENGFERRNGIFYQFCERARDDEKHNYVFIIDEINRGNLSKIFGELMMLLEADKRSREWEIPLAYSSRADRPFFIPGNVYVLGLMNTADRSLAVVDYALRRRFAFVDLLPAFGSEKFGNALSDWGAPNVLIEKIVNRMIELNVAIAKDRTNLGPGFCIGHSFFCDIPKDQAPDEKWYRHIIESEIAPLLREYWFDEPAQGESWIKKLLAA